MAREDENMGGEAEQAASPSPEAKRQQEAVKEEEVKGKAKEASAAQAAAKEARNTLKERRKALEASKGHYEEGSEAWTMMEQLIKQVDQEIEQTASPQRMPYPENAYKKCAQQLRVAKTDREAAQKEVDRLQQELEARRAELEAKRFI